MDTGVGFHCTVSRGLQQCICHGTCLACRTDHHCRWGHPPHHLRLHLHWHPHAMTLGLIEDARGMSLRKQKSQWRHTHQRCTHTTHARRNRASTARPHAHITSCEACGMRPKSKGNNMHVHNLAHSVAIACKPHAVHTCSSQCGSSSGPVKLTDTPRDRKPRSASSCTAPFTRTRSSSAL